MRTHRLFFAGILSVALLMPNACSDDDTTLANTPQPEETTAGENKYLNDWIKEE